MKKVFFALFVFCVVAAMCPATVPPPPAITQPNGGESLISETTGNDLLDLLRISGYGNRLRFDIVQGGEDQAHKLGYITQNHYPLCASGACSFQWEVGAYEGGNAGPGNDYYIEIVLTYNGDYSDFSDNPFSIVPPKIPIERLHGFVEFNPDPGCPMCGVFNIGDLLEKLGHPGPDVIGDLVILRGGRQVGLLGKLGRGGLSANQTVKFQFGAEDFSLLGKPNQGFEVAIMGAQGNILKRQAISLKMRQ